MSFFEQGFEIVPDFMSTSWRNEILEEIEAQELALETTGIRHIDKKLRSVANYISSSAFRDKSNAFVPEDAKLVRAIFFNKSPEANWYVTWHQDRTVAVSERFEASGWNAWSIKEDVLHVQPPLYVLNEMVTIRIHLDAAPLSNGCLQIIPGSHMLGLLSTEEITHAVKRGPVVVCEAEQCAALIMRPHLLHSSRKSQEPKNRRVLHLEFSNHILPDGINWF